MNKSLLVLALTLALGQTALAHEEGGHKSHRGFDRVPVLPGVLDERVPKFGPCSELNLDSGQKAKLKAAYYKFKEEKIDLESNIKKARLKYEKLETSSDAEVSAAEDAGKDVVSAASAMMQAGQSYRTTVAFEILKPAQRATARACMKAMWKFHERREHREWHKDRKKSKGSEGKSVRKEAPSEESGE